MFGHEMLVGAALAFAATVLSIRLLKAPAVRWGLVDHPNRRKRHEGAIPLIGGLAMFVGLAVGWAAAPAGWSVHWSLPLGVFVLAFVGLVDDRHQISSKVRLLIQVIVALVVVVGGLQISSLGHLLGTGSLHLTWLGPLFTVLCIVLMINALNMLDGVDGLAGSVALFAASGFAILALVTGMPGIAFVALILCCALFGFLLFNLRSPWLPKARVFMGDSGSMVLGFLLAWLAIALSQHKGAGTAPVTVAWVLLLPAVDILTVFARRLWWGRSPMAADRSHFHHVLLRAGLSVSSTVSIIALNQLVLVSAAILLHLAGVSEPVQFTLITVTFLAYFASSLNSRHFLRAMHRRRRRRAVVTTRLGMAED